MMVLLALAGGILAVGIACHSSASPPAEVGAVALEDKLDSDSVAMIHVLKKSDPSFWSSNRVVSFGCDTHLLPSCGALVDVPTIEEYYRVVAEEIFLKVLAAGADPCQIILSISVTDNTLWKSYDPAQDPQVTQCRGA